jgi:tRNA uridine 5-carboxymethylaminomethyl modification enzyme
MSTSLPEEVQIAFLRTLPGLEEVEVMRPGYAVEYDFVPPDQLLPTLESKTVRHLYFAGQINGTSGYEEAAGQGLIAGVNAALSVQEREPLILPRSRSYIGVMIDDLVTKGVDEPYRLLTSRAEHRLLLRQDNADSRLTAIGREIGLVDDERWDVFHVKQRMADAEAARLSETVIRPTARVQEILSEMGAEPLAKPLSLADLLRRSDFDYDRLAPLDPERPSLPPHVTEQVTIDAKYVGYIRRQEELVDRSRKLEERDIPAELDFRAIAALSTEGKDKLTRVRPLTLGQASRIPGVTPADLSVLTVYLEALRRRGRETEAIPA